jgi:hypothetical protein
MMKRTFQHAITLADGSGGIEVQRRPEFFGELVDGEAVTVKLVVFIGESGRTGKHEGEIVAVAASF